MLAGDVRKVVHSTSWHADGTRGRACVRRAGRAVGPRGAALGGSGSSRRAPAETPGHARARRVTTTAQLSARGTTGRAGAPVPDIGPPHVRSLHVLSVSVRIFNCSRL